MYKGILFVEGYEPSAKLLGSIEYKKNFSFNAQMKTLDCVKDQLVERAMELGGNAVVDFKYGQKTSSFFKSWLFISDDNIKWFGNGIAAIVPEERIKEIMENL